MAGVPNLTVRHINKVKQELSTSLSELRANDPCVSFCICVACIPDCPTEADIPCWVFFILMMSSES